MAPPATSDRNPHALRLVVPALLLLAATSLAGCEAGESTSATLGGSFRDTRTDADIQEFNAKVAKYGAQATLAESFPEQFTIAGFDMTACEKLRAELVSKPYIAVLYACSEVTLYDY